MGPSERHRSVLTALTPRPGRWRQITGTVTASGLMLAGLPLALDYVVRPGDTLSEIAERRGTSVQRIVSRNHLRRTGDMIFVGQTLRLPGRSGKGRKVRRARHRVGPDARRLVRYTVKPGDTPSGLAVRFHAWTDEVVARNGSVLHVGERITIPVVVAAARKARLAKEKRERTGHKSGHQARQKAQKTPGRAKTRHQRRRAAKTHSRTTVRRVVARTARRHGVDPDLALAVAWQESGWQMHHVSHAGAIGAMQVLPATGRWMSQRAGRRLHLHDLRDNATAGVLLIDTLLGQARLRRAVAGYYQGLAGVRRHGMYRDTRRYVASVLSLRKKFRHGRYPV
jgi:LysM repeat protein